MTTSYYYDLPISPACLLTGFAYALINNETQNWEFNSLIVKTLVISAGTYLASQYY